jgi:hypothetical protein
VEDDRLAHHGAEARHAHRQPLGDLPAVQRQVSAPSPASHQSSISFGKAVDSMRKLLEQANALGNIRLDRGRCEERSNILNRPTSRRAAGPSGGRHE